MGLAGFVGITAALMAVPLLALLGSILLWGILATLALALSGVWWALQASWRRGRVTETLHIWRDHLHLTRHNPDGSVQTWDANPYWVDITLHPTTGPVPHYLTLSGGGRVVELGTFLSEPERVALAGDLTTLLHRLRGQE